MKGWKLFLFVPIIGIFLVAGNQAKLAKADSPDPYSRGDQQNSGVTEDHFNPDIKKQWSIPSYPNGAPIIIGNIIYYLDYTPGRVDRYIKAVELYSKKELWSQPLTDEKSLCPPVYYDGKIITCEDGILILDAQTGNHIKYYPKPSNILDAKFSRVVVNQNTIIGFTYGNNYVFGYKLENDNPIWQTRITGFPPGIGIIQTNNKIIFNTMAGEGWTYCINTDDGSIVWFIDQFGSIGELMYLSETNRVYDLSRGWAIDVNTGQKFGFGLPFQAWPFAVNNTIVYYSNSTSINFTVKDAITGATLSTKNNVVYGQTVASNQVMIDGKIYFVTNKNNLVEADTSGNILSSHKLNERNTFAGKIIIDHGRLLIYSTERGYYEIGYYDHEPVKIYGYETFEVKSPYVNFGEGNEYLGQLHSHYIPDLDWSNIYSQMPTFTPATTEERYRDAGYDFIALTEHNAVIPDPQVDGILHIANSEEDTQEAGGNHILAIGVQSPINENAGDQERINEVVGQNGLAFLSHPNSKDYSWSLQNLVKLVQFDGIEAYNGGIGFWKIARFKTGADTAFDKLDQLLTLGKKTLCVAGDDYTPGDGGFDGAAVVVLSESNTQTDIIKNLKAGNFYALQGSKAPRIKISSDSQAITVTANKISNIKFIGKGGQTLKEEKSTQSSTYLFNGDEIYVRAEVEADGKKAWSQAIFINPKSIPQNAIAGEHQFSLGQAKLLSKTSGDVQATIVNEKDKPTTTPPLGYFSPVYSFETNGEVLPGTELSIDYTDKKLTTSENNLSIFTYNSATSEWGEVASTVDTTTKTVKAQLEHFSLYTLSAEAIEDTEKPIISLTTPIEQNDLIGEVNFVFSITDNEAVVSKSIFLDDNEIDFTEDNNNQSTLTINTGELTNGNHKLYVTAEDYNGNITEKEIPFSVISEINPLQISLTSPVENEYVYDLSKIAGTFSSYYPLLNLGLLIDDVYISDLNHVGNSFEKEINWSQFKEGPHKIRVVTKDTRGNIGEITKSITVGQQVTAKIVAPIKNTFMHSDIIPITVTTTPPNANIKILMDSKEIANNSTVKAYDLTLGDHKVQVNWRNELIAEKKFTITTSIADQIKLVKIIYKEGHINNQGIANAIIVQLEIARIFELFRLEKLKDKTLKQLTQFIQQQSTLKNPKIDKLAAKLFVNDLLFLTNN